MAKVLIKKLDSAVQLPAYKSTGASGMDLMAFIKNPINVKPNSSSLIPTGLSVAFPFVTISSNSYKSFLTPYFVY